LRLLYISKYASYAPYGLETRHFYISRELAKMGYKPTVYLSTSNHNLANLPHILEESLGSIKVKWIPTLQYSKVYGLRRIASWFHFEYRLRRELRNEVLSSDDIVICSSLSLLTILSGIKLKKKWGCKLVFEVRDIWPLVLKRLSKISKWNPLYQILRAIEIKGYQSADIIIGTMPNLKEHVDRSISKKKKVLWIPHLVNEEIVHSETHRYSNELAILKRNGSRIIGYAGSINKSSALSYLLEAATAFYDRGENIHFILVGFGPKLKEYKAKYSKTNIHFFDKIPQNEVVALCTDCDILYDGYLKSELYKFGNSRNKYVEYCIAKKPILLAYEGFTHFVEDYGCGVVVEPESVTALVEGIEILFEKEEEELLEMGTNAYTFAQNKLNLEKQVDELIRHINFV